MALADTVVLMALGRIVWVGSREEADEERLASAYLGSDADHLRERGTGTLPRRPVSP
jgi:hypothetical protein